MKTYEIRHRESNRKGYFRYDPDDYFPYKCSEDAHFHWPSRYTTIEQAEGEWVIPKDVKRDIKRNKVSSAVKTVAIWALVIVPIVTVTMLVTCINWDYNTGQDTGYISAVDKMTWSNDYTIYLRRRPLNAQGFTSAERDEVEYCTTSDYPEVVQKAYEAITSGKRVVLVYDKPKEFGWKKISGCNSAPITDVIPVEE